MDTKTHPDLDAKADSNACPFSYATDKHNRSRRNPNVTDINNHTNSTGVFNRRGIGIRWTSGDRALRRNLLARYHPKMAF